MLKGRTPTALESRYMAVVRDMGCIVCRLYHHVYSPAEIHHISGKTEDNAHFNIIPLCVRHHRGLETSTRYTARHQNKAQFERRYMTEERLRLKTLKILKIKIDPLKK